MLGFSVAHLTATRTSDGPDLVVSTPAGHIAVVECTTGLLNAEKKLPTLYDRFQAMRRSLDTSGNNHIRLLPIIVTIKRRDDVATELEQAGRHGIWVLTRESVDEALNNTIVLSDADKIFDEAERTVRTALERHTAQGVLPLQS